MIIEAARTVIADRGLHATTVRDIAAAAEVAVGTVTYHFSGIAEVLAGVLESEMGDYSAPIMARAAAAPTGRAGLAEITEGLLASGTHAIQHWKLWLDFWALAARYPRYSSWQSQVYRDLHALVASIMDRGTADGSLAVTDPQSAAVQFIALLDGLVVQCYLPDPRITPGLARAMLTAHVTHTLVSPAVTGP